MWRNLAATKEELEGLCQKFRAKRKAAEFLIAIRHAPTEADAKEEAPARWGWPELGLSRRDGFLLLTIRPSGNASLAQPLCGTL